MTQVVDLVGETFGDLLVIARAGSNKHRQAVWTVDCSCGKQAQVSGISLRKLGRTDCGDCAVAEPVILDWDAVSIDGMAELVTKLATDAHRRYRGAVDLDDLVQEANVFISLNGPRMRAYLADPDQSWKYVASSVWRRLGDVSRREVTIQSRQVDYDLLVDE